MMSNTLTLVFITLLLVSTFMRIWLGTRQIAYVKAHRKAVPEAFANDISLEAHQKAADYTLAKVKLTLSSLIAETLLLLALTLGGGLQWLDSAWHHFIPVHDILRGAAVISSALLISGLLDIPFDYYKVFSVDERFGFNKMSKTTFWSDTVKNTLLSFAIFIPILFVALWLMQSAGNYWWFYLWIVFSVYFFFVSAIYPIVFAPIFNKFTPLTDENFKARIEALLTKCGFKSQGLFVMDGSTRSSHGNAYFTGFGASKRIVFFDTLLEGLDIDEIEAVLAHELGHFKHRHVIKSNLIMFSISFLCLAMLGWLIDQTWFYQGLGVSMPSNYMALILFMLVSPVFLFLLRPLMASYSRKNEFEADAYAAQHASAKHLTEALVKLYRDNASTLTPDPLHSAFYDSHPPASIRIAKLSMFSS